MQNESFFRIKQFVRMFVISGSLLVLMDFFISEYLFFVINALSYPFGLDYGENAVLQHLLGIPSSKMYGDITIYPFTVFNYPPVYYFAVRFFSVFLPDYLLAGRFISILSAIGVSIVVFCLVVRVTRPGFSNSRFFASLIGASTVFTFAPVSSWSVLMRVDMLALMLSFLGIYAALRSIERPALLYFSALVFILALFTKQTMIAAPLATFGVMFFLRPKLALKVSLVAVGLGSAAFFVLTYITQGGFFLHVIKYNINPFNWAAKVKPLAEQLWIHSGYIFIVLISLSMVWNEVFQNLKCARGPKNLRLLLLKDPLSLFAILFTIYFLLSAVMIFSYGKVGSNVNYFLEWVCCWSVLIGVGFGVMLRSLEHSSSVLAIIKKSLFNIGIVLILFYQVQVLTDWSKGFYRFAYRIPQEESLHIIKLIRKASKPVIASDPMLIVRAGKEASYEPFTNQELVDMGFWDQSLIIDLIRKHAFEFIITNMKQEQWGDDAYFPYNSVFHNIIIQEYPRIVKGQYYQIHYPRE